MFGKKYNWHKIADSKEELSFESNDLLQIEVNGKQVCIARNKDILSACAYKCPHAGGILGRWFYRCDRNIVCPLHRIINQFTERAQHKW
ncbi:MAG: Rieske 2Fe-2S domain-containing protein [Ferruginibacter sp.]